MAPAPLRHRIVNNQINNMVTQRLIIKQYQFHRKKIIINKYTKIHNQKLFIGETKLLGANNYSSANNNTL